MQNFMLEYYINITGECLADDGDSNKTMIQNILVVLPKNFLIRPSRFGLASQQPRPQPHRKPMEHCQTQCRKTYTNKYYQYLVDEWEKIPNSMLSNLVSSMNHRCQMIIDGNGERINY